MELFSFQTSSAGPVVAPTIRSELKISTEGLGTPEAKASFHSRQTTSSQKSVQKIHLPGEDLENALRVLLDRVKTICGRLQIVAHRVVHGGPKYDKAVFVDNAVESEIEALWSLAPLHNPLNLMGLRISREHFPGAKQIAVFDTAFYHELPEHAARYPLPAALVEKYAIRRYGFHGISHKFVTRKAAETLGKPHGSLKLISCHLGSGCSVTAVDGGKPIDTSMGFTPLEGLMMGKRSGDIDPGLLLFLDQKIGCGELRRVLNEESGLLAVSQTDGDIRSIVEGMRSGRLECRLAFEMFCYRLTKYIGAYATALGGIDALLFTAGIGENCPRVREDIVQKLGLFGAQIAAEANQRPFFTQGVASVSSPESRLEILVVKTEEARAIAEEAALLFAEHI